MKILVLLVVSVSLVVMCGCTPSPTTAVITTVTPSGPCSTPTCTKYYRTAEAGQVWYTGMTGAFGLDLKPGTTVYLEGGRIIAWKEPTS